MANTKRYQHIVQQLLEEYAAVKSPFWPNVHNQIVADKEGHHYQLIRIGWDEQENFVHDVVFHFDLVGSKIWVQANNTDRKIVDELVTLGAKQEDIILGFQTPLPQSPQVPVRQAV